LRAEVAAGRFRQDLFFRLNVLELRLPSLRERAADAPLLAERFLREFDARGGRYEERRFAPEAERLLMAYSGPGNVREVRNLAERLSILTTAPVIGPEELTRLLGVPPETARGTLPTLDEREREYVAEVMRLTGGNKSAAAEILGITRNTLYAKIRTFGLGDPDPDGT
ncbi:MAG TPA: helix-turn-helix domain-containing protein, partial [Thermoanaerobaculia bacterium]|nr:helix-turn-helix domain-containing protein [Thermoanaerobaculia bacterium]